MSADDLDISIELKDPILVKNLRRRKVSYSGVEVARNDGNKVNHNNTRDVIDKISDKGRTSKSDIKPNKNKNCRKRNKAKSISNSDVKDIQVTLVLPKKKRPYGIQEALSTHENNGTKRKRSRSFWMDSYLDSNEIDNKIKLTEEKMPYNIRNSKKTPEKVPEYALSTSVTTPAKRKYRKNTPSKALVKDQSTEVAEGDFPSLSFFGKDSDLIPKRKYSSVFSKLHTEFSKPTDDNSPLNVRTPKYTYSRKPKKIARPATLTKKKSGADVKGGSSNMSSPSQVLELSSLPTKRPRGRPRSKTDSPATFAKTKSGAVVEGDSPNMSSSSQVLELSSLSPKRSRGRPRSTYVPTYAPFCDNTTSTSSMTSSSQTSNSNSTAARDARNRRSRPRPWWMEDDGTASPEKLSEYELQRQQNIQQNLIKLKEIFTEKGIEEFDVDSSQSGSASVAGTPKKRYSRTPLPPPRPRSLRLEQSRPLNFSSLFKKDAYE